MATVFWLGGTGGSETDVNTAANYSPSGVPTTGDALYVEANPGGTDYDMAASLSALSGVTLASLNVSQTYTGNIGTATAYLQLSATALNIGYQFGGTTSATGSNRIKINLGSVQTTAQVTNTASSTADAGLGPVQLLGTHASNVLNIYNGTVSVALTAGEVSTFATITNSGTLSIGSGATLTTINVNGGSLSCQSAMTTLNLYSGTATLYGSGAVTTANIIGGTTLDYRTTGTLTTANVAGTLTFANDARAKTVTTINGYFGGAVNFDNGNKGSITLTNPLDPKNCRASDLTITSWVNEKVQFS